MKHWLLLFAWLGMMPVALQAQDDLLDLLEAETEEPVNYAIATFKGTRLINGHSIENPAPGVLQFMIGHRFGRVNGGAYEFFGLDNATIRLGFDYGVNDRLAVGVGRSSFEKTYDGYAKYKIIRQQTGKRNIPFSLSAVAGMAIKTIQWPEPERDNYFSSRLYYHFQALLAAKVTPSLSLQLSPTLVHRNLVATPADANDVLALGIGGRQKLSGSLTLNAEWFYVLPNQIVSPLYGEQVRNTFSIGFDIETGGHVFQLHFTNSRGMAEKFFVPETTGNWLDGDIHFGFNISRVFTIKEKHNAPDEGPDKWD